MSEIDAPRPRGNFLTGKLGPLPVWAWGSILGVGVLGFYLLRNRASATTATPAKATDGSALDSIGYVTAGLGNPPTNTDNSSSNASGSPQDNTSWINTAATAVAAQMTASSSAVLDTLNRYVYSGGTFTGQEQKWIDTAINLKGAPPQGTNGTPTFSGSNATATSGYNKSSSYTFVETPNNGGVYFMNAQTGKSTHIANTTDWNALKQYVNAQKSGASTVSGVSADQLATINNYFAAVN